MCPPGNLRFSKGKLRFARFSKKISKDVAWSGLRPHENAKRRIEVASDLMRVVQSGPACEMCGDYYYYLSTGKVTTEPQKSQKYPHESLKVQTWTTWAHILGVNMRSGPRGIVSSTEGKLMIPRCSHDVSIEIAMQGTGAHKSGPKGFRMRIM